jgi:hypothetical protein
MTTTNDLAVLARGAATLNSSSFMRNRFINGDMRIDQRSGGGVNQASNNSVYTIGADRWGLNGTLGTCSIQRSTTSPPPGYGFSTAVACTSAVTNPNSGQYVLLEQIVEGQNIADFACGSASAAYFTISFWVKSNLTGTYGIELENSDSVYQYNTSYTINNSNTWEYKTITINPQTVGNGFKDYRVGLFVRWVLASGKTSSSYLNTWSNASFTYGPTGQTNLLSSTSNVFYMTGAQIEIGKIATPFELRDIQTEYLRCQRYFQTFGGGGLIMRKDSTNAVWLSAPLKTQMRPTTGDSSYGTAVGSYGFNGNQIRIRAPFGTADINLNSPSFYAGAVYGDGGMSTGMSATVIDNNNGSGQSLTDVAYTDRIGWPVFWASCEWTSGKG